MNLPKEYIVLDRNTFSFGKYSLVPIRYEDRYDIMQWRNEQIYHLRQTKPLSPEDQDKYFNEIVSKLFNEERPTQILFSYLVNDQCIGYGGLVHINWIDKNAEISFIMKTELEQHDFTMHWGIYLDLIEQVAFSELNLHKLYTYAFDLRTHLYDAIEQKNFNKEAVLKEHCFFEGKFINVVIHSKMNKTLTIRKLERKDEEITFKWASDEETRKNSFNSKPIMLEEHSHWFNSKLNDQTAHYFICEVNGEPGGLIRFDYDKKNNIYIIGITIDPKFRGKKLSTTLLNISCETFSKTSKKKIVAFIKEHNIASKKAFERAGFKLQSREIVNTIDALKYEYKNE